MRGRIIEAAALIFRRDGHDAKIEDIASAVGTTRQTVYNHFGSKEGLYRAVTQTVVGRAVDILPDMNPARPLADVLRDFAYAYWRANISTEALEFTRFAIPAVRDMPELGALIYEGGPGRSLPILADHLRARMATDEIAPGDADVIAEAFIGAIIGHARSRFMSGMGVDRFDERQGGIDSIVTLFAKGLER